jgi:hypothetical protein
MMMYAYYRVLRKTLEMVKQKFRHVIHMQTDAATFLIVFAHGKMSTAFASGYPGRKDEWL